MRVIDYVKRGYEAIKDFYRNAWGRGEDEELGLGAMVKEDFERIKEEENERDARVSS